MEKEFKRVRAEISLQALSANFEAMHRKLKPGTKMAAVIKADGYGHGAVPIARLCQDYEYIWGFAVATAEEAMELKDHGIEKPVLILGHVFDEDLEDLIRRHVRITVSSVSMAAEVSAAAARAGTQALVHIAVDTGMSRIGFADNEESKAGILQISRMDGLGIEGIFTHFARADETDIAPAKVQLSRFTSFTESLEKAGLSIPLKHCSNSAGIMRLPEANMDMVRAGITIYGIYPSGEVDKSLLPLQPVMELKSHVSHVKTIQPGTAVSYGGTYTAPGPVRLATIPVGYADGYPRQLSGRAWVLIRGKKAPVCGRVCMDQFMVDVTGIEGVMPGDEVTLLGRDGDEFISVDTLGGLSGRFPYEFVCDISKRVPRVYV